MIVICGGGNGVWSIEEDENKVANIWSMDYGWCMSYGYFGVKGIYEDEKYLCVCICSKWEWGGVVVEEWKMRWWRSKWEERTRKKILK